MGDDEFVGGENGEKKGKGCFVFRLWICGGLVWLGFGPDGCCGRRGEQRLDTRDGQSRRVARESCAVVLHYTIRLSVFLASTLDGSD